MGDQFIVLGTVRNLIILTTNCPFHDTSKIHLAFAKDRVEISVDRNISVKSKKSICKQLLMIRTHTVMLETM